MKQIENKTIINEVVVDVICDLCGKSTKITDDTLLDIEQFDFGTLTYSGGYYSKYDGSFLSMDICTDCINMILQTLNKNINNYIGNEFVST